MTPIRLHDKLNIEEVLRRNTFLHIYGIGDLDDFFWPYTTWYASEDNEGIGEIALLYAGPGTPTLLGLSENPHKMSKLLVSLTDSLPPSLYAHLSPGVDEELRPTHDLDSHGEHLKMGLVNPSALATCDYSDTCRLGPENLDEVIAFFDQAYPDNWFNPRMLETNQYFGIREKGKLVSVGGIHVYSRDYKVAALGNIAVSPFHRRQGYARRTVARLCRSLLKHVDHIGLNVKADNTTAVSCYKKLGFETVASYYEVVIRKKQT